MASIITGKWTTEWPKRPGFFLFYGKMSVGNVPEKLMMCHVIEAGSGDHKFLAYVAGGMFMYKKEWNGVFLSDPIEVPEEAKNLYEESFGDITSDI
jgi:hypothetical protein